MPGRWKFKVPSSRFSVGFLVDDPVRDFCLPQSDYFIAIFSARVWGRTLCAFRRSGLSFAESRIPAQVALRLCYRNER